MDLGISGLASGFDWRSLVDQLTEVERSPQTQMKLEQSLLKQRSTAYSVIQSQLSNLQTKAEALKDSKLFDSRATAVSDSSLATATATGDAAVGSYKFEIVQLASSSAQRGAADIGGRLSATDDVSTLALSSAGFSSAVTAGSFTVNGKKIDIVTSDTLQQVFDKISTATGGAVTASYSASSDKISLTAAPGTQVVLGSSNDTSNFLGVTRLSNNGTNSVTSSAKLGAVLTSSTINASNLATTVSDGGSGAGQFKVNGVSISFNTSTDTLNDVLARINNSSAGVNASFDAQNDRFVLTNKTTGDLGVALEDVTGNFLAATGLSAAGGGALERGKDLQYHLNDGAELLTSKSNTIDSLSSGVPGLSLNVIAKGTVTVGVSSDTSKIKKAINEFIAEYNKSHGAIDNYTASSTDKAGKVTAGVLAGDRDAFDISSKLRSMSNGKVSGLDGTISLLSDLGIESNGTDNTLTLKDETKLDDVLANNLSGLKEFFTKSTTGLASRVFDYVKGLADDEGQLDAKQKLLGSEVSGIDTQIADQERQVQNVRSAMMDSFVAMEKARAAMNQQLQYLNQKFGSA